MCPIIFKTKHHVKKNAKEDLEHLISKCQAMQEKYDKQEKEVRNMECREELARGEYGLATTHTRHSGITSRRSHQNICITICCTPKDVGEI